MARATITAPHPHARARGRQPARARLRTNGGTSASAAVSAALLCLSVLVAGCSDRSDVRAESAAAGTPVRGGQVVLATAQEPPVINPWLAAGAMAITDTITDPLNSHWVRLDDRQRWVPQLATTVPTAANGGVRLERGGGMTIRFAIREQAHWSDGAAITCDDLRFTWQTVMDDRWEVGTRNGWDQVAAVECPTDKQVVMRLRTAYAPYLSTLLFTAPLPAHELRGRDFDHHWSQRITVSSGPFVFGHWRRGVELVLERSPDYWAAGAQQLPHLDRVVFRFVADANTMKLQLRMGEVDAIGLPPDTHLRDELATIEHAETAILPGAAWENLVLNVEAAPLDDVRVRRAIAHAIDRETLIRVALDGEGDLLQSTLLPSQRPWHRPTFARYRHDAAAVAREMRAAGYERDTDGAWTRSGRPVLLRFVTTAGNPVRAKLAQLLQEQLRRAGFATTIALQKAEVLFSRTIAPGNFHLSVFSFGSGPDPSQTRLFACEEIPRAPTFAGKNDYRYCNRALTGTLHAADAELDPVARERLLAHAQQVLADDVPVLPLFQPPDTLSWNRRVRGVRPNPMGRHLWNAAQWWVVDGR